MFRTALHERLATMPMLKLLAPFVAGMLLAERCELPAALLAAAFLLTGLLALTLRSQSALIAMLAVTGFAAVQLRTPVRSVPLRVETSWVVRVEGIPADRGRWRTAEAVVEAWREPESGLWHAAGDRILLYADSLTPIAAAERLCCRGRIRPFDGAAAYYRRLMLRRGTVGTLWLGERNLLERLGGQALSFHVRAAERLRRLGVGGEAGAVVQAMAAGDRSALTPELRAIYARSGFAHLLAVSGLHTGLLFAAVFLALWWLPLLRRGHIVRNVLCTAAVWLFAAAAGFPPSAVRAAVMCTLLQAALAAGSEYVGINALAAAAFGMLLWQPAWLREIGFQLSFIAVGAILAWGVPLCRRLRTRWRAANAVIDALVVSFVASLSTAPLAAHAFGIVPLAGILLNPAAILLATVAVCCGTAWMLLPLAPLAPPLRFAAGGAAEALDALARFSASIPGGALEWRPGSAATAGLYLLFLAGTLALWSRPERPE